MAMLSLSVRSGFPADPVAAAGRCSAMAIEDAHCNDAINGQEMFPRLE